MTIMKAIRVDQQLSTANHPQTDGQSERMIQTVEQYLRHYLDFNQDNWVEILPMAQFAINNSRNATTHEAPHFANLGRHPRMTWNRIERDHGSEKAMVMATKLEQLHSQIAKDIEWAEDRMKQYYDRRRKDAPDLQVGERVYLLRRTVG